MPRPLDLVVLLAWVACSPGASAPTAKKAAFGVRARVLSGWARTPATAQSLEWLRDVDLRDAAAFLRQLGAGEPLAAGSELAPGEGRLQASSARTFHELLVRNSYYSPRIEALRTLERRDRRLHGAACAAGSAWALLFRSGAARPTAACSAAVLRSELAVVEDASAELPSGFVSSGLDLPFRSGTSKGVVLIYGAVSREGLPSLGPLLRELDALPDTSPWRAIFRHADGHPAAGGRGADALTGYGFELAIKSSEYKTHPDEKKEKEREGEAEEAKGGETEGGDGDEDGLLQQEDKRELDGELELDGLLFHVLLKRHEGTVRSRLWALKEQLEVERDTDKMLKAWEVKDIGLQATAKIKSSPTPLLALMRLSQNFPAHVAGLARATVPDALRRSATKLRHTVPDAAEVFAVNGRLVRPDHSDLSLFPMMKTLQPYFVGVERLVRRGLSEKLACELLQDTQSMKAPERLDWRSPHLPPPVYLVTKDRRTAMWDTSLWQSLMFSGGGLSPIRLALYHLVYVFDPGEGPDLLRAQHLLQQTPLPVSYHFVMVSGSQAATQAEWDEQVLGARPEWLRQDGKSAKGGSSRASAAIAASFGYLLEKKPVRARAYIKALVEWAHNNLAEASPSRWPDDDAGLQMAKQIWLSTIQKDDIPDKEGIWDKIILGAADRGGMLANASQYVASLGVPTPCMLINGQLLLKGAYEGQQSIWPTIAYEQQMFQQAVYTRAMTEETKVVDFLASKGLMEAYHEDITPGLAQRGGEEGMQGETGAEVTYIQWPAEPLLATPFLESIEPDEVPSDSDSGSGTKARLGLYHVTVLRSLRQAYLLRSFASHLLAPDRAALKANAQLAVPLFASYWAAVVDAPAGDTALTELAACVRTAMYSGPGLNRQRLLFLKFLGTALPAAVAADAQLSAARVRELCKLGMRQTLELEPQVGTEAPAGEAALLAAAADTGGEGKRHASLWVCNGRVIGLEADGQPVFSRHVQALELLEAQYDVSQAGGQAEEDEEEEPSMMTGAPDRPPAQAAQPVVKALHERLGTSLPAKAHGLVAAIRSEALAEGRNDRGKSLTRSKLFDKAPAAFRLRLPPPVQEAACPIKVYGILDPLSATAQSASAVLALFGMAFNAEVNLVFNPRIRHSEYPLKRYYREVIRWPERLADGRAVAELEGGEVGGSGADFPSLATKHVLTAAVHALPTWLVTAHEAEHDMDNLRLVDVGDGKLCETTYVLRQLYVEGQAFILGEDGWPIASAKGLQMDVIPKGGTEGAPIDDTIVMGNLGYFQVHGNPGFHEVSLKTGLSNDTFEAVKLTEVEVSSYITPPYQLRVKTRPGRSHSDLFEEGKVAEKKAGLLDWLKRPLSFLTSEKTDEAGPTSGAGSGEDKAAVATDGPLPTIHIFSVASGHLYEKLLGIMILSVRNNTKSPLVFHFIDNFLSPKFKAFIPQMAKRYNFQFSFVTYKWPSWLNPQSEKQRLIWAYKVLFLDVLFPMDVPKVLFIDADQVVRADVRELWDMDLKGRVYGFVPMGDTNPATEGFRFWKQGYWKNHLGSLPYHISALYVVDLTEFRRTSIGDQLRGVYNQLSRDPNSLSNLEQDLINFAQHQVPIFSLPAEWLWCETWCSQESKAAAKTIDLCQNPLTKEPKIVMAKRIIKEWQMYHDEVQRFQDEQLGLPDPAGSGGSAAGGGARKVEL